MARRPESEVMSLKSDRDVPSKERIGFRADLLLPPKSQVAQYEDAVTARVIALNDHARKLGAGFGIPMTDFVLNPVPGSLDQPAGVDLLRLLRLLSHEAERVSLERRDSAWGLFFTREPPVFFQHQAKASVPLKDAPLDVRERFLEKSEQFFRAYIGLCEDRLARMKSAVSAADHTIELVQSIQPT